MRKNDEWQTPQDLYDMLNKRFRFRLDPCTTSDNPLGAPKIFTKSEDGLSRSWKPGPVFMNPPYSNMKAWCAKAWGESREGVLTVGLIRLDPTTKWWKTYIKDEACWVWPLPKRVKFRGASSAYNFPNAIVVWHGFRY